MHRIDAHGAGLLPRLPAALTLGLALVHAASPARAAGDTFDADAPVEVVEAPGFFGTYFPWTPDDALPGPVDDAKVLIYVLNLLPLGGIWGPLVALEGEGRPELGGDVIVPWLVPTFAGGLVQGCGLAVLGLGAMGGLVLTVITQGAGILCLPCCLTPGCVVTAVGLPLQLWTAPTAAINAWGRAYAARDRAVPESLAPSPRPAPVPAPAPPPPADAPATTPPPAQPPAGEWGPPETPGAPAQPAPPAPGTAPPSRTRAPSEEKTVDESEWVPY